MIDFGYTINELLKITPYFLVSFLLVLILTPLVAKLAVYINAIDIPTFARGRILTREDKKLHPAARPRLGGLGIALVFILMLFITQGFSVFSISIGLGVGLLILIGVLDDVYDLSGSTQMAFQILAILVMILGGTRITEIGFFGTQIALDAYPYIFPFFDDVIKFVFPGDIITLFWFLVIINAMNWVAGIDALEESLSIIAGFTLMLLAIKFGRPEMLVLASIFTASTLGFWIYNYPPAKIIGGTIANTVLGFLLGMFAIKIDGKMTTSIFLLALPLVDFIWVIGKRLYRFKEFHPLRLMAISGDHHLHHRLMQLGYSVKQVLLIEMVVFSIFAAAAYYLAGFNILAVAGIGSFAILMLFFVVLKLKKIKRRKMLGELQDDSDDPSDPPTDVPGEGTIEKAQEKPTPESVYAY